jgi:hypothetical protein
MEIDKTIYIINFTSPLIKQRESDVCPIWQIYARFFFTQKSEDDST